MLKLKKIHILGFKSFCDRTELSVPGTGIAVVVGPERVRQVQHSGRGELGAGRAERQDAARHAHAGRDLCRNPRPQGAGHGRGDADLVDPEAYEGPIPVEPEVTGRPMTAPADWDEDELRRQRAAEAEEIIAAEQPGQTLEDEVRSRRTGPQSARARTAGGGAQDSPPQVPAHPAEGRDRHHPAALPHRRERVPAERQAVPAARHSGHLHGHRPGAGELRDHRARSGSGSCSAPSRTTGGPSSKKRRGLRASRPRSGWPSCAWKAPSRTWPAWTTSLKKSRGR
jgi:hypothetical protein